MPTDDPGQRFEDMLENVRRIQSYTSGMNQADFLQDQKTIDAVERCLERIAEAARKLGDKYDGRYPELKLRELRNFGSVLRHDYDDIQPVLIWGFVTTLLSPIEEMARREIGNSSA
jgi:uncharacterized protein with HEPN domain